eukprot:2498492-Prymnesium_polylepis.1
MGLLRGWRGGRFGRGSSLGGGASGGAARLAECAVNDERGEDDLVKGAEHLGEALVVGSLHHDLRG